MFLNFRRSHFKYVFLWIITLGIYSYTFRREITYDINTCIGVKKVNAPTGKFFLLNLITFGYYGRKWDIDALNALQEYLTEYGSNTKVDFEYYTFMLKIPFARVAAMAHFINILNESCKIYSDIQLEELEDDDYMAVNRVRDVDDTIMYGTDEPVFKPIVTEKPAIDDGDIHRIAGHAVIEEYDPTKDYKRISYKLRMEREARAAAREAALHPERVVVEKQAKSLTVEEEEPPIKCKRGKRWLTACFASMLAIFVLPVIFIAVVIFALPPVYDDTFVGALSDKYDRLNSFEESKLVVVGGSSVAFGLDSELMSEELTNAGVRMPVVNFGLYADLGTKYMMDLSKSNINEGDIIILAPELNDQTLSMFFNGKTTWQSLDGNLHMLPYIESEDYDSLIGSSYEFAAEKFSYLITGERPKNVGAYQKGNFNSSGDNIYDRPYNIMMGTGNPIILDYKADFSDTKVTPYEEFIAYVNDYVRYCVRKGATVYFSFAPMNEAAMSIDNMSADGTTGKIDSFYDNLCDNLECKVISNVYDYILDEGYFYDTEFHLNNAGVVVRTVQLINDLKRALEDDSKTEVELPEPPGYLFKEFAFATPNDEEWAKNFEFEAATDAFDRTVYMVIGLTAEGKTKTELTVPNTYNGSPVTTIAARAFASSTALKTVYWGENITSIETLAFGGSTVTSIYIPDGKNNDSYSVPNLDNSMFDNGANVKIYVDAANIESFRADDYKWGNYYAMLTEKPVEEQK